MKVVLARLVLVPAAFVLSSCRTPDPQPCASQYGCTRGEFVVYGDTRPWIFGELWRPPAGDARRAVIARIAEERPDFVLNTGDLVASGSASDWAGFDAETAALRARGIAYFGALGNHDLWPDAATGLANWNAHFPALGGARWYGLRYGRVDLVVLDSNCEHLTQLEVGVQDAWLAARLDADEADDDVGCVLLAFHHAPMTNSFLVERSDWVTAHFVAPARTHPKVRAIFAGHVHSYEHFVEHGIHFIVSGGGGAPLMDVAGPNGRFHDVYDGPRGHHFCRVTPGEGGVRVEVVMLGADGRWTVAEAFGLGTDAVSASVVPRAPGAGAAGR